MLRNAETFSIVVTVDGAHAPARKLLELRALAVAQATGTNAAEPLLDRSDADV